MMKCKPCEGTGKTKCSDCNGEGLGYGHGKCMTCDGSGLIECTPCDASGKVSLFQWMNLKRAE